VEGISFVDRESQPFVIDGSTLRYHADKGYAREVDERIRAAAAARRPPRPPDRKEWTAEGMVSTPAVGTLLTVDARKRSKLDVGSIIRAEFTSSDGSRSAGPITRLS